MSDDYDQEPWFDVDAAKDFIAKLDALKPTAETATPLIVNAWSFALAHKLLSGVAATLMCNGRLSVAAATAIAPTAIPNLMKYAVEMILSTPEDN